jgi:hypothetical protein
MKNEYKSIYQLRKEDFIPIVGLFKHTRRCLDEMHRNLILGEDYASQCFGRDIVLVLYNAAIIGSSLGIASGLLGLLNK